jgi:hypothetical protein
LLDGSLYFGHQTMDKRKKSISIPTMELLTKKEDLFFISRNFAQKSRNCAPKTGTWVTQLAQVLGKH